MTLFEASNFMPSHARGEVYLSATAQASRSFPSMRYLCVSAQCPASLFDAVSIIVAVSPRKHEENSHNDLRLLKIYKAEILKFDNMKCLYS